MGCPQASSVIVGTLLCLILMLIMQVKQLRPENSCRRLVHPCSHPNQTSKKNTARGAKIVSGLVQMLTLIVSVPILGTRIQIQKPHIYAFALVAVVSSVVARKIPVRHVSLTTPRLRMMFHGLSLVYGWQHHRLFYGNLYKVLRFHSAP